MTKHYPAQSAQPVQTAPQEDEINLIAMLGVLWRGKFLILLAMFVFSVLGGYYAFKLTDPKFNATSVVVFSPEENNILDLESIISRSSMDTDSLNTKVATIESRETLEQLVQTLNLTEVPEFNPKLTEDPDAFSPIDMAKSLLGLNEQTPVLTPEQEALLTLRRTTDNVRGALSTRIERDAHLLNVTATSEDPELAATMANTLAEIYIEIRRDQAFSATEQAIDWLSERVRELENDLRGKETEINTLRSETDLINRDILEQMSLQAKDFRDRLSTRQEDLVTARSRLVLLENAATLNDSEEIVTAFGDVTLRRILQLQSNPNNPPPPEFQTRVEALLNVQRAEVNRIDLAVSALMTSRAQLQAEIEEQTKDLQRLDKLQRELEITGDLYRTFLTGLQEVTVQVGLVKADANVLSRALPPLHPVSPNTRRILVVSALLGGMLVAAWLLIRDSISSTVRTGSELEKLTGHRLMGEVPGLPIRRRRDLIPYLRDNPTAQGVEAVRNVRTSLLMASPGKSQQLIMLTSSVPGEGKTTLAISLAVNLAGLQKKVLLVEADIRRNTLLQYFTSKSSSQAGKLLEVLDGSIPLASAVQTDPVHSVDILLGKATDVNAADLLSSDAFRDMLEEARTQYDYVIVDTPPVLVVPDARVMAPLADSLLFVVKWDSTPRGQVLAALRQLEDVGQEGIGLALTQVDIRKQRRYDYGSQYGGVYGAYDHKY